MHQWEYFQETHSSKFWLKGVLQTVTVGRAIGSFHHQRWPEVWARHASAKELTATKAGYFRMSQIYTRYTSLGDHKL